MSHGSTTGRSGRPIDQCCNDLPNHVKLAKERFKELCLCLFRLDFDYLNELPVLVLDVSDDFKNDRIKREEIVDKVGEVFPFLSSLLCVFIH